MMELIDLSGVECEEAIMSIRFYIRKNKLEPGDSLTVKSLSEPFWIFLSAWASAFTHSVIRQDLPDGWSASITLK